MIFISKPNIGLEEKRAVTRVLDSGQLAQGQEVESFEQQFAGYCGVQHGVAVSSGTAALCLALLAHGVGPGDEVITTAFTFIASANSILYTGARPVFVDIDPHTFNIDPERVEVKITPRTKAIMPVHLFGKPCEMPAIMKLAGKHNLAVVEDACQAHGAAISGQRVGSFGTGCFSFYATKNMTTAEGGIVTTNSDDIAKSVRAYRAHGMSQNYLHASLGYNFRMTDIQAAMGNVQLRRLDEFNEQRWSNAEYLLDRLQGIEGIILPDICSATDVVHQFTIKVPQRRDALLEYLNQHGVGARVFYPRPVHKQPLYEEKGYRDDLDDLADTEELCSQVLSLPIHPLLNWEQLDAVANAVGDFFQQTVDQAYG